MVNIAWISEDSTGEYMIRKTKTSNEMDILEIKVGSDFPKYKKTNSKYVSKGLPLWVLAC